MRLDLPAAECLDLGLSSSVWIKDHHEFKADGRTLRQLLGAQFENILVLHIPHSVQGAAAKQTVLRKIQMNEDAVLQRHRRAH